MNDILDKLFSKQDLDDKEIQELFGTVSRGELSDISTTAALIALKSKGESPKEIASTASFFRDIATDFESSFDVADTCGTGGDGAKTINISTIVAICASAMDIKIAKHGNKSISSSCGSADVLNTLGFNINMSVEQAQDCLEKTGFTFLFAPHYHKSFANVAKIRQELKTRTIFNVLGPLINPAKPSFQVLGVYDKDLCLPLAKALKSLNCKSAMVVNGTCTDEINLQEKNYIALLKDGKIEQLELNSSDFGLENYSLETIKGGDVDFNAKEFLRILKGDGTQGQKAYISANLACLLYITNKVESLKEGVSKVQELLNINKAFVKFQEIIKASHG